jgi:hypothetical protein
MKVFYTNDFRGFYPVGTAAVIVARDLDEAYVLMTSKLIALGLGSDTDFTVQELTTDSTNVVVLCDGEY